jgi:hypothetical protein
MSEGTLIVVLLIVIVVSNIYHWCARMDEGYWKDRLAEAEADRDRLSDKLETINLLSQEGEEDAE